MLINPFDVFLGVTEASTAQLEDLFKTLDPTGRTSFATVLDAATRLAKQAPEPPIIPNDGRGMVLKLIQPLRSAKVCFLLKQHLATIALCGTAAEMLTLLLYRVADLKLRGKHVAPADERALFGQPFERVSQDRRIKILVALSAIDQRMAEWLQEIRRLRNEYVHLGFAPDTAAADDAKRAYITSIKALNDFLAIRFEDGAVVMRPALLTYLRSCDAVVRQEHS